MFKTNGKATKAGICFVRTRQKTMPKLTAMPIQSTVQTGPKRKLGGAQDGFTSEAYQVVVVFMLFFLSCVPSEQALNKGDSKWQNKKESFVLSYFFAKKKT